MTTPYALGVFSHRAGPTFPGIIRDGAVWPLSALMADAPASLESLLIDWPRWDEIIFEALANPPPAPFKESELRAHLPHMPKQLYGAGANYRRHVIELIVDRGAGGVEHLSKEERRKHGEAVMDERAASGKPFIWVGLLGAIAGAQDTLVLPRDITQPDWELELAIVIGKPARRVRRDEALSYVAGYTIANDVTARELVDRPDLKQLGMDWMACKNAPGFNIIGPYITPARFVPDPQRLHIRLRLNGETMQDEGTDDMIFDVARLIEFASQHTQLYPGDIIMTGSPSGNGTHYGRFLRDGDVMEGEIDGLIGRQRTPCVAE